MDRRAYCASSDDPDRIGWEAGGIRRRPDPDSGACPRRLDHGLRLVPDGHAGRKEGVSPGCARPRDAGILTARPCAGRRISCGTERQADIPTHTMTHPTIGIIGGSGLYDMAELTEREER